MQLLTWPTIISGIAIPLDVMMFSDWIKSLSHNGSLTYSDILFC